jgi:hypothetical protein
MEYGAIDPHKKESQIRIVTRTGEIIDRRIATTRDRFTHVFWGRPRMRVLVEASTESEWVDRRDVAGTHGGVSTRDLSRGPSPLRDNTPCNASSISERN